MNSTRKPVRVYGMEFYEKPGRLAMLAYIVDKCGYCCDYCYNPRPRTGSEMDLDQLRQFVEMLVSEFGKEIYLDLIGGETTCHPGLVSFVERMAKTVNVTVYSNFSKDTAFYRKLLSAGCSLILTYHPHVSPDVFLSKFAEFDVSEYGKIISVPIMYRPGVTARSIYVFD